MSYQAPAGREPFLRLPGPVVPERPDGRPGEACGPAGPVGPGLVEPPWTAGAERTRSSLSGLDGGPTRARGRSAEPFEADFADEAADRGRAWCDVCAPVSCDVSGGSFTEAASVRAVAKVDGLAAEVATTDALALLLADPPAADAVTG